MLRFIQMVLLTFLLIFSSIACSHYSVREDEIYESDGFWVRYQEYVPSKGETNRAVVILPPTGGSNLIDRSYARGLVRKGARVKLVTGFSGEDEKSYDLQIHERIHKNAIRGLELVIQSFSNEKKVAVMGTSLGGLFVAIAVGQEIQFERALVVAAGAPIPRVIVDSDLDSMRELKKKRFEIFSLKSDEDYYNQLSRKYRLDPLSATLQKPGRPRLAMVILTEDDTVPTSTQRALQNHWHPVWVREMENGHFWGIVSSWLFHRREIQSFLIDDQ